MSGAALVVLGLTAGPAALQAPDPEDVLRSASRALAEGHHREALRAFDALLLEHPGSSGGRYGRAVALEALLDAAGAAAELERLVALEPTHAEAWRGLVRLLSRLGRRSEAGAAWRRAAALGPIPRPERLELARALRKAGQLEQAAEALGDGELPLERLERGLLAAEWGDDSTAARELARALADPGIEDAQAELWLGRALESLDRGDEARRAYGRALELDPGLLSARFRLGSLLLRAGRESEGRALLEGYEELRQWDRRVKLLRYMIASGWLPPAERREKVLQLVSLLLQGGRQDEAGPLIDAELSRRADDPPFLVARARWLAARGELAEARSALAPLLGDAATPDALWLSARLLLMQQQAAASLAEFERLLATDPRPPARALKEAATAAALAGQPGRAEALFRRALEAAPNAADVHADLALLLQAEGRRAEAEAGLRRALDLDPGLRAARLTLAGSLESGGAIGAAIDVLREGIGLRPDDAGLRQALAEILERAGRGDEAAAERAAARGLEGGV